MIAFLENSRGTSADLVGLDAVLVAFSFAAFAGALLASFLGGAAFLAAFGAFVAPVVEVQDLPFARRQVVLEDLVDALAHEPEVGVLLDLYAIVAREALAQRAGFAIRAVDRCVERQLGGGGRRHAARYTGGSPSSAIRRH